MRVIISEGYRKTAKPWDDNTRQNVPSNPNGPAHQLFFDPEPDSEKNIEELWNSKKKRKPKEEAPEKML